MGRRSRVSLLLSLAVVALFLFSACSTTAGGSSAAPVIHVVAAENFYGNLVQQLGGSHVAVTSILSDPNIDPHEYEANVQTAEAVSQAQLVIENGIGYDTWMDKLLSASPNSQRIVLVGGNIAKHKLPDNPHVWYGVDNMPAIALAITGALKKLDAMAASTFDKNLATFQQALAPLQLKIGEIHAKYASTPVALTETIYLYQSIPEGLNVLTPIDFEKAIAEGNDPPADTLIAANKEISGREAKVLIYNVQTITSITTNLQNEAKRLDMPVVPVSETMPPAKTYQGWMLDQLDGLQQALATATGR